MPITLDMVRTALDKLNILIGENKDYLTELDSAIGDADHGINMTRGMTKVAEKLGSNSYNDFSGLLKDVAVTLMSAVGGSAGPLYGTFFMKMGQSLSYKKEASTAEFADAMETALAGIMNLGRAQPGDKTMIDTLAPAVAALKEGAPDGDEAAWERADTAAEEGMKATIPMLAKRGRSSYLGERSIGHQDPGATSSYYMIRCFREAVVEK